MGMMSKSQENMADLVYSRLRNNLITTDNFLHVVMVNSFSKIANQNFDVDNKYNTEINLILSSMQQDGFCILDVKINSLPEQGMTGNRTSFNTLITYKYGGSNRTERSNRAFSEFE